MSKKNPNKLVLVYNTDNTLSCKVKGFVQKMVSPTSYPCALCSLTHGNFGMNVEWKEFVSKLKHSIVYRYRDEFTESENMKDTKFPVIYFENTKSMIPFMSHEEIMSCKTVDSLIESIENKIEKNNGV